jgi:hypothetical protein
LENAATRFGEISATSSEQTSEVAQVDETAASLELT